MADGESGGGGSGGGEPIGVAQEAITGCCCPAVVGEKPVKCTTVYDPSECKGQYFDGECNAQEPATRGTCLSVAGSGHDLSTSADGFALLFALALGAALRRRRPRPPSGGGAGPAASRIHG